LRDVASLLPQTATEVFLQRDPQLLSHVFGQEDVQNGIGPSLTSLKQLHDSKTVMDLIYILRDTALGRGASKL